MEDGQIIFVKPVYLPDMRAHGKAWESQGKPGGSSEVAARLAQGDGMGISLYETA